MIIFQEHHYEGIERNSRIEFIAKNVIFLKENQPKWCQEKSHQDICHYIETVLEFAQSCSIVEALAIQKLVFYQIELGFSLPPQSLYHQTILSRNEFDDQYRVDRFVAEYSAGIDYVVIRQKPAGNIKSQEFNHASNS
jgi:hypothetical protein